MNNKASLKDMTIRSMVWSFMDNIGSKLIQIIIQLFFARLLLPYDFGVLGMVTIFIVLSNVFIDFGFIDALIRDKESNKDDFSTIFYFNVFVSAVLYSLLYFTAGYISEFFEVPELVSVIRVMGIVLIIDAIGLIPKTILTKMLQFSIQMKINVATSLVSGLIGIGFALAGYGLWSLVIKVLILQISQTILYLFVVRWKPSFVFSFTSFRRLFDFGWKLLVSRILNELYNNVFLLIIGRGFSTASLGFFTNAKKLSNTVSLSIMSSVERVSYPILSKIQDDDARLKNGYRSVLKNLVFISFPILLGLVVIAPSLFRILLGDNWIPAIPYFQVINISGLFLSLHLVNLNVLQVKGRSDLFLRVNILEKVIGMIIVGGVLLLDLGIFGLIWGLVGHYFVSYFINASYSKRLIGYSITEQLRDIRKITGISLVMAFTAYSLKYLILENDWLLMFSQFVVCVIIYFVLSYLFKVEELKTIYQVARPIHGKILYNRAA